MLYVTCCMSQVVCHMLYVTCFLEDCTCLCIYVVTKCIQFPSAISSIFSLLLGQGHMKVKVFSVCIGEGHFTEWKRTSGKISAI